MIHTNEPVGHSYPGKTPNTLAQIYAMIKQFPHNRIILAHWGGGIFLYTLLKKEVRQTLDHVWFDTAASPFLYHPQIYQQAIALAGEDKILLGNRFPSSQARALFQRNGAGRTIGPATTCHQRRKCRHRTQTELNCGFERDRPALARHVLPSLDRHRNPAQLPTGRANARTFGAAHANKQVQVNQGLVKAAHVLLCGCLKWRMPRLDYRRSN